MSFFLGKKQKGAKPEYSGVQIQTSSQDVGLTIAWGGNRFAPNVIWYDDFASHKQKQKAGKGGGSVTSYTYSASFMMGLSEGPIHGVGQVWKDQDTSSSFSSLGFTLFDGSYTQTPWGYLSSKHPDAALAYRGVAYLAVSNYDLGQSASLPQFSYEVFSLRYATGYTSGGSDADCALVVYDFLLDVNYGVGFTASTINMDTLLSTADATGDGDRAYQTYCRAMGWGLSPVLSDPESSGDIVERWMTITNTAIVWTGYDLKFIPQAYSTITGHGVTYNPNITAVYSLTDNDFLSSGEDPVSVARTDPVDCKNSIRMLISDKSNQYNQAPIPWKDQGLIDQYGLLQDGDLTANEVTDSTMAAMCIALYGKRGAYIRNSITITLGVEYSLLEAMDIIEITDVKLGTILLEVRQITEQDDETFEIVGNELQISISSSGNTTTQGSSGYSPNTGAPAGPVNTPLVFEPPSSLSNGSSQVWAAVSGGDGTAHDPNWGGANVFVSADGGGTYQQIGQVLSAARMGKLTAALAAYAGANPDTTHTASVDLTMSGGDLQSVTSTEASNGSTVCVIRDSAGTVEFLSYEVATLTTTYNYNLTNLYRGQYGSSGTAHSSGAQFARLDDNVFQYDLPSVYVGVALKFKFQSFNIWGGGLQDLSDCVEYDYTPVGTGISTGAPTYTPPNSPSALTGAGVTLANNLTISPPSSGPAAKGYNIYGKVGASGTIADAALIGSTTTSTFTHAGLNVSETWRYFAKAYNDGGVSTGAAGPTDVTTSSSGGGSDLEVDSAGVPVVTSTKKLNFKGSGVTVADAGSGQADITISGGGGGGGVNPPSIVQKVLSIANDLTFTLPSAPTAGNLLVALTTTYTSTVSAATGWTQIFNGTGNDDVPHVFVKIAGLSESVTQDPLTDGNPRGACGVLFEISDPSPFLNAYPVYGIMEHAGTTTSFNQGVLADGSLILGMFSTTGSNTLPTVTGDVPALGTLTGTTTAVSPRGVTATGLENAEKGIVASLATWASSVNSYGLMMVIPPSGGGGGAGVPKPVAPFLATFPNSANTPQVTSADGLGISLSGATASSQLRYLWKTLPAVNDTFILGVRPILRGNYNSIGLIFRDSTSGRSVTAGTSYNGGDIYEWTTWNSDTSSNTSYGAGSKPSQIPMFVKVDYDASTHTLTVSFSLDMLVWFKGSTSTTTWLSAPDQVGLVYRSFGSTVGWGTLLYYKDASSEFDYSGYIAYTQ